MQINRPLFLNVLIFLLNFSRLVVKSKMQEENDENNQPNLDQPPPQEEEKKIRKKPNVFRFKQDALQDTEKGLKALYDALKEGSQTTRQIAEIEDLNNYMKLMEEWHYFIVPKYDFAYFIKQCQTYGQPMRPYMEKMRKAHKSIIPWDFLQNNVVQDALVQPEPEILNQAIALPQPVDNGPQPDQMLLDFVRQQAPIQPVMPSKRIVIKPMLSNKKVTQTPHQSIRPTPMKDETDEQFLENFFENVEKSFDLRQQQRQTKTDQ